MSFEIPRGTRGVRPPAILKPVLKALNTVMSRRIRKTGRAFGAVPALVLTTVGAKSGLERRTPLACFPDGRDQWLIVASYAGAVRNPDWYHNIAAHPDQVRVEIGGRAERVTAEELRGPQREAAWARIIAASDRFAGYQDKTDRVLPIIRLTARRP